jgi:hypothetical protein
VKMLLEARCDPTHVDGNGWSLLQHAEHRKAGDECISLLIHYAER